MLINSLFKWVPYPIPLLEKGEGNVAGCPRLAPFLGANLGSLHSFPIKLRLRARTEQLQGSLVSGCVGTIEYPVLPCRQSPEDLRLQSLIGREAQTRLHTRQRIGR